MDIIMPKMGESVSEGTIIKWHKQKGDAVKRDEVIFEISTDKVDTEIPAPADGILSEVRYNEGDTVAVGTVVAVLSTSGEASIPVQETAAQPVRDEIKKEAEYYEEKKPDEETKYTDITPSSSVRQEQKSDAVDMIELTMPKMGESVMEGTIIKWHKKVGDNVKKDETVFEISTDKVDTEVPSPINGTLAEILVGEQETVEVGTVVAKLSISGVVRAKAEPGMKQEIPKAVNVKDAEYIIEEKHEPEAIHDNFASTRLAEYEEVGEEKSKAEGGSNGNKFLSPLVLSIARKEKVSFEEIYSINGTGLDGRVTKKDILSYIEMRSKRKAEPLESKVEEIKKEAPVQEKHEPVKAAVSYSASSIQPVYSSHEVERIPMDNIRQKVMQHMINSRDTSVHVSAMLEVDMTRIYNFLKANRDEIQRKQGIKFTYMPFVAHACIKALKEYPLVNSTVDGYTIVKKKFINLGIAVAVEPNGLIVPNIKNADERNIIGLARAINDIAERSRTKRLTPDDITNGTFSITNYGVFGTIFGTPIINQPEVAILGVGTVVKKPVVVEMEGADTIAIKPIMALTLTHDHRLVDGMLGGRFLKSIKDTLESFSDNEI